MIKDNLEEIQSNIQKAKESSNRTDDVTLIAVTKNRSIDEMREAQALGITNFGENKAQEILRKHPQFEGISWHFIGHLQTNKVADIIDKVDLIHSVDSIKLACEINKQAARIGKVQDILLQINVSGEESKHGFPYHADTKEYIPLLSELSQLTNIRIKGIMTMAPNVSNIIVTQVLHNCNVIYLDIRSFTIHNIYMDILSMGMTNDYQTAVECGSNMVRVGSGLFKD